MQGIGLHPLQRESGSFLGGAAEHGVGKIRAYNGGSADACLTIERKRHVAGSAAKVQHGGIAAAHDVAEAARGTPPPVAIDVERKNVIEQVIARRDAGKHLAHGIGCGFLILGWLDSRTGSGYSGGACRRLFCFIHLVLPF